MPWKFKSNQPIYKQIVKGLKIKIISEQLPTGSKLSSVRELAEEIGVNPNTIQRALGELEQQGLIYTQRTNGKFVTEDDGLIKKVREEYGKSQIRTVCQELLSIGYTKEELAQLIREC